MAKPFLPLLGFSLAAHGAVAVAIPWGGAGSLVRAQSEITVDLVPAAPAAEPVSEVMPPVHPVLTYAAHPRSTTVARRSEAVAPVGPAPAPVVAAMPSADLPRFSLVVSSADSGGSGTVARAGLAQVAAKAAPAAASDEPEGPRVSVPASLVSSGRPEYPPEARAAAIEADVPLEIVVDEGGRVVESSLLRRAGHGFDESALQAIRTYRFAPAQRDGQPVRVRMRWSVAFRLQ
jgi:TonB family protein